MPKTLVIIPAFNEEASIEKVINNIKTAAKDADILVVNDASKDKTSEKAKESGCRVINLPFNLGIGGAMQTGYLYAYQNNYDAAIQIDGDNQHNPIYIEKMLSALKENDMIIGSRYIEKTKYKSTFFRRLGMKFFTLLILITTGEKITDTTSGFRCVNKKIIRFFALNYPTDYPEVEVLIRLTKQKYKISEISVEMQERKNGKSFATPVKSIYYMIKVTFGVIISSIRSKKYYN